MTLQPCLVCGELATGNRCPEHQPADERPSPEERGYDSAWRRLSERARRLQPFCSDCFTRDDLTTDHSETAWRRKAEGKPIRLRDVDVLCRSCNAKRGRARPTGDAPRSTSSRPSGKAKSATLSTSRDLGDA